MIGYQAIREGIADAVAAAFDALPVTDDNSGHIMTPAVLVNLTDEGHVLFDLHQVHRELEFDVVYLAEPETPPARVAEAGQQLAACFQPWIEFAGRRITVDSVTVDRLGEDARASFSLAFYDDLDNTEPYEYMRNIEFEMVLTKE